MPLITINIFPIEFSLNVIILYYFLATTLILYIPNVNIFVTQDLRSINSLPKNRNRIYKNPCLHLTSSNLKYFRTYKSHLPFLSKE